MKVQSVKSVNFSIPKLSKKAKVVSSPEEDLQFRKSSGRIMRRAFAFSAVLLTGAIFYFKKKSNSIRFRGQI